jgi:hypothetical protein
VQHLTHWHTMTDCIVMGSYATKEQAEHAVYEQMQLAVSALLRRWTRDLLDNGVITFAVAADEVEGWLIEQCSHPLDECDPPDEPQETGDGRDRLGHPYRTESDLW